MAGHRIVPLGEMPAAVDTLTGWFEAEWAPYYGADGPGDARGDLLAGCRADGLPRTFIALDGDNVVGTAALTRQSMASHPDLSPWLAALLVAADYRGRGVGSALVAHVAGEARRQGFSAIYCGADPAATLLPRLGWRAIDSGPTLRGEVAILRRAL